jgi:hypothetical protein
MSHHLQASVVPRWHGGSGTAKLNRLLGITVLTIALFGCGSPASRDVLAYNACITRHPQETALCEGPRQAYQLDPTAFLATAASGAPADGSDTAR